MKRLLLLPAVFSVVFLVGCFNYSDIEDSVVASGIFLDKTSDGLYSIVAETVTEGESFESNVKSKTLAAEGKTVYEAMENLKNASGKPFDFSHCQVIFIGENAACDGIEEVIDTVFHCNTMRLTVMLVAVEGDGSVFECSVPLYNIVSYGVFDMLKQDKPGSSVYPSAQAYVCMNTLEYRGKELIIPTVSVKDGEVAFSGLTVFSGDKAVGKISSESARRYLLLMGKLSGGDMTVEIDGEYVSFEIEEVSSERRVGDNLQNFEVEIKIKVAARQLPNGTDLSVKSEREALCEKMENAVEKEIENVFYEIRDDFGSDVFAFGDVVYHTRPNEWKTVSENWSELFKESELTVICECVIDDAGRSSVNATENER